MTGITSTLRGLLGLSLLAMAAIAAAPLTASAQQVQAKAQVISVVESGDFIDVQLKVIVTNSDGSVASNVLVRFEDGLQVSLGDVAPGQSAVSATQTESFDISLRPTHHVPVPVKVTFMLNDESVELSQMLVVDRPAPQDPVQ
jgi:protein-disulfide isomerase